MTLFDEFERTDHRLAEHGESQFATLNRCARPSCERIRSVLESWFVRSPAAEKEDLRARFRSANDVQHSAAFFELFLHELLLRLGCCVEVHPESDAGQTTRPDFRGTSRSGMSFFAEARLATGKSEPDRKTDARLEDFYRVLARVESSDFFIGLQAFDFRPENPLPARKIRDDVQRWLSALPYPGASDPPNSPENAPKLEFSHEGTTFTIVAIAKKESCRGQPGDDPLAAYPVHLGNDRPYVALRDAVIKKASKYGVPELPYVVAVCTQHPFASSADAETALFGYRPIRVHPGQEQWEKQNNDDSVWVGPTRPKRTRVSAVLVASNLYPWSLANACIRIYRNPWAAQPILLSECFTRRITEGILSDGRVDYEDGVSVRDLLELPEGWPFPE